MNIACLIQCLEFLKSFLFNNRTSTLNKYSKRLDFVSKVGSFILFYLFYFWKYSHT